MIFYRTCLLLKGLFEKVSIKLRISYRFIAEYGLPTLEIESKNVNASKHLGTPVLQRTFYISKCVNIRTKSTHFYLFFFKFIDIVNMHWERERDWNLHDPVLTSLSVGNTFGNQRKFLDLTNCLWWCLTKFSIKEDLAISFIFHIWCSLK